MLNKIKKSMMLSILCVTMMMVNGLTVSAHETADDESYAVIVETRSMGVYYCPTHNIKLNGYLQSATPWQLISTTKCPSTSVGQGDPVKYHYTYLRTAIYKHTCSLCSYNYTQSSTETMVTTNCGEH